MELFKLFGTIAIGGVDETTATLNRIGEKAAKFAKDVADKLDLDVKANTDKAESEFDKLSDTIQAQERVLEALKKDYAAVVLEQGKNSTSAKKLAAEIKDLSGDLKKNKTSLQGAEDAADKLDRTLDGLNSSAKRAGNDGFTVLRGAISHLLSSGVQRLLQMGGQLLSGATKYQSQMEQYTVSFQTMTGSAEKAVEITERLKKLGATTPFEMTDLADATQLLMNYGFEADDAVDKMLMLGDISQGSAEKMGRIAMAYGQMSSAGKVSLEDVKQMIEAGFNPLQEISQTTGESMSSLYDRISKGTISVDEITASMQRSTSEGGKYFGSMNAQSQTLEGRLSTLKDTINSSLGQAMLPILEVLANDILPKITKEMENVDWEDVGQKAGEVFDKVLNFGKWVIDNKDWILGIGGTILGIAAAFKVLNGIIAIQNALMLASPTTWIVMAIVAAIAALIAIIVVCVKNWDKIKEAGRNAVEGIKKGWEKLAGWFKEKVVDPIKKLFDFKWELPKLKTPKFSIQPKGWKIGDLLDGKIPKLGVTWAAEGGIFDSPTLFNTPTGALGVGEAGAEAVAPIDKLTGYVQTAVQNETSGIAERLDDLITLLIKFFPQILEATEKDIVLSEGTLVGRLAPLMNAKFNDMAKANARGR